MDLDLKQKILYYGHHQFYQTMHFHAAEAFKKFPNDSSFRLLSGYALLLVGRYQEAIRELDNLPSAKDVNIGAMIALIYAHRHCQTVDKETVLFLEEKLKTDRKTNDGAGLYYASLFFYYQQKYEKSKEYLGKFFKQNNDSNDALCLKGWLEMKMNHNSNLKTAASCFKIVLEKDKKHLDAVLGLVKIKELEKNYSDGLSLLNQLILKTGSSIIPLVEKAKLLLSSREWEQACELSIKILNQDSSSIDAHKIKITGTICREGNFNEGAIHIKKLMTEVEKIESKNAEVYIAIAELFASVACRKPIILHETISFAEKAVQLQPGKSDLICQLGFQNLLIGKLKEATRFFKNATKLDDSSVIGLTGLTMCQIASTGVNEQIKQQVEFLREIQSDDPSPELLLMTAKLAVDPVKAAQSLQQAAEVQLSRVENIPFGISYIQSLNVDLLTQIVKENMHWAFKSRDVVVFYKNALHILEVVRGACPGLMEPQLELARINFLLGNLIEAKDVLTHILDKMDASLADAHVLMAQIHLKQKNYTLAARSVENSLSHNFKIREHPLYHLVAAMVHKQNGNVDGELKSLKTAIESPAFCGSGPASEEGVLTLSLSDRATIYLELVDVYKTLQQTDDAEDLIRKAMEEFKGTTEEGSVFVANAQLLVHRGNMKGGIELLQKVQPDESYYVLARQTLANVYLAHLHNRDMYAQCYLDLVKVAPSQQAFEMLGDAYTSIQEPDSAILAYEEALKFDRSNSDLICKMGKSLVTTHYYTKAINYYKEAVKSNDDAQLLYDMAQLYFKLGQLDNAERILMKHINDKHVDSSDIKQLTLRTRLLQLLAKVRDKSGSLTDSLAALKDAKENHCKMDKRTLSQSDAHKAIVVDICYDTAVLLTRLRDFNSAIKVFKDALNYRPNDSKILVGLAGLYMQTNNMEECQQTCHHLLSTDAESKPAAIMLADIAFRNMELDSSAHHLKQLLAKEPDYWTALARLIEVSRRLGNLEEVVHVINRAEEHSITSNKQAGLFYCKGLYDSYRGEPQQALIHFNRARGDAEWGELATHNMIDICLNPDHDTLGGEEFYYEMVDNEIPDAKENALKTAKRLLLEVKPRKGSDGITHRLLEDFWLLATRQKANIEKALQDLIEITADDYYKEHVGVSLAISTAFMLQKQVQKARNHLKRMVKTQWRFEDAEYLERSWLLLADIHIQNGKTDLAADLIQRVLEHNKSCYKAYEYAGYIAEKEQLYKEASFQYENAWRYNGRSNPAIGFKLAFNYMKAKAYADAIDTCHAVLSVNPNYPRIRKEIMEKSRNHLRT